MAAKAFWSYAREDEAFVHQLSAILAAKGIESFLYDRDIRLGEHWQDRIRQELERADLCIAVLSPASRRSNQFLMEVGAAWAMNKPLVPILRKDSVDPTEFLPPIDRLLVLRADNLSTETVAEKLHQALAA